MKKIAVVIFALLLSAVLNAQLNKFGTPIVKSYSTEITHGSDQNWWINKDKFGAVYFANDVNGVIRYDGKTWTSIPVRGRARLRALDSDSNGIVYVGGSYEFGFIEPDSTGSRRYVSLSQRYERRKPVSTKEQAGSDTIEITESVKIGEIYSVVVSDSNVYYLSNESLFIYNTFNQKLINLNFRDDGFIQLMRIYKINGHLFLSDNNKGIVEFIDGKLVPVPGGRRFERIQCFSILPVSDHEVLVSTYRNGLFLLNYVTGEIDDKWVDPVVRDRIQQVYCSAKLPSGEFVLGTVNGDGIYVLDKNGKLTGIWNFEAGVTPDNVIYALYADPGTNELWVTVTGYILKVYTDLPYTQFSQSQGIDAAVIGLNELGKTVYTSTDIGVLRSIENEQGARLFELIDEISDQVFPIIKVSVDNESFLIAGSIQGLFRIDDDGKVTDIIKKIIARSDLVDELTYSAYSMLQSLTDPHIFFLGTADKGLTVIEYRKGKWNLVRRYKAIKGTITSMATTEKGDLFFLSEQPNILYRLPKNDTILFRYEPDKEIPAKNISFVNNINHELIISTGSGLYIYAGTNDSWIPYNDVTGGYTASKRVNSFFQDGDGDLWVELDEGNPSLLLFSKSDSQVEMHQKPFSILPAARVGFPAFLDGKAWIGKSKNIYIIDKEKLKVPQAVPSTIFTRITIGGDSVLMDGTIFKTLNNGRRIPQISNQGLPVPEIKYNLNSISFYWTSPSYLYEDLTQYSYFLEGFAAEWSKWDFPHYKDFTNLPYGEYVFRVKARTSTGIESPETTFVFEILKPWYLNTFMIILYVIAVSLIILGIIAAYTRNLKNENLRLESIIADRTKVVVKQKEELESSIHYASRIQMALLPSEAILSESIKNYFVLFRPRDIVSGDFYWMTKKSNRLYIVAADCTGHGVPGAFMSLLGMSFLDEIIDKDVTPRADMILNELRQHVTDSLKQSGSDNEAKDGMDMSLLVIDFNVSMIEFSGAYNPCFRVRKLTEEEVKRHSEENVELPDGTMTNGKYLLETIYASKMPIGISSRMDEKFIFHNWKLEKGVSYYLFSDGYIDQFGGPSGRKFMKKNFKRLILDIQDNTMSKQKEIMEKTLQEWMGKTPQIDDILVMGIRTE